MEWQSLGPVFSSTRQSSLAGQPAFHLCLSKLAFFPLCLKRVCRIWNDKWTRSVEGGVDGLHACCSVIPGSRFEIWIGKKIWVKNVLAGYWWGAQACPSSLLPGLCSSPAPAPGSVPLLWQKPDKSPVQVRRRRAACPEEEPGTCWCEQEAEGLGCTEVNAAWEEGSEEGRGPGDRPWDGTEKKQSRAGDSGTKPGPEGRREPRKEAGRAEGWRQLLNFQTLWGFLVPGRAIPRAPCSHMLLQLPHSLNAEVSISSLHPWPGLFPSTCCWSHLLLILLVCLSTMFCWALPHGLEMPRTCRWRCHEKHARECWCNEEGYRPLKSLFL